ncbi:hypothetical protein ABT001_29305 [Streptomyces sp. NPDC002793]|uniref:hypothetical protein n=1 Tax=Streptomyces sp. NPDC002793 TaxID=3154432 RepID=UPI0033204B44
MASYEDHVLLEAMRFRRAIEDAKQAGDLDAPHPGFRDFPQGSCGAATVMLCTYLAERGLDGWLYACGKRENPHETHAWAEREGLVVDITADQFPAHGTVYVGPRTPWFDTWEPSYGPPKVDRVAPDDDYLEGPAYRAILRHLP